MQRLNRDIFFKPPAALTLPDYKLPDHDAAATDKDSGTAIVHLGVGAFHRAHQAVYTERVNAGETDKWLITGASLRSDQVQQQLAPQDYLYTVVERENDLQRYRLVQAIEQVIVATQQPQQLIEAMAHPLCKIISLTITEKGYCHNPATGKLDLLNPDIQTDLKTPATPHSAAGFIVAALRQRRANHLLGVSILSCDNLPANGKLCRQIIIDFATCVDPQLAEWIDQHCSFPSSMVDRIVPACSDDDREAAARELGYYDHAMVICEPFSQWVIEDDFVQGRPAWENAGATFVEDVYDFENMKLRLLNGSHSAMAYLGFLAGYQTIDQVVGDKSLLAFIGDLMAIEITPTVGSPQGINLENYKANLLQRFANSSLKHRTQQIAMDGSQKIPQRLLKPIEQQLQQGGEIKRLCLALAGWICYCRGIDRSGEPYAVSDPMSDKLQQQHQRAGNDYNNLVDHFLSITEVFPKSLSSNAAFKKILVQHVKSITELGVNHTVATINTHGHQ